MAEAQPLGTIAKQKMRLVEISAKRRETADYEERKMLDE